MAFRVIYYTSARGDSPVKDFIESLDQTTQAKFFSYVGLLMAEGPNLKRPYADTVAGKIRELRPRRARVFYFFTVGDLVVLLHGMLKKTQEIRRSDIDVAESRMRDWLGRHER